MTDEAEPGEGIEGAPGDGAPAEGAPSVPPAPPEPVGPADGPTLGPAEGPAPAPDAAAPAAFAIEGEEAEVPSSPAPPLPSEAAFPGEAAGGDDGGERSVLSAVRDNLEAIAFALVLALLLRHFCIEVFKIPTKSMEPTLFGDDSERHPRTPGDRILVDKLAYLLHGPDRWDVVVFHYPLDWSRNFIKRVTGVPNELLRIERGDIWTAKPTREGVAPRFRVARKPARQRDEMYQRVFPPDSEEERTKHPTDYWRSEKASAFQVRSSSEFAFAGDRPGVPRTQAPWATLTYGFLITDNSEAADSRRSRGPSGNQVADVRWRGRVLASGPAEFEVSWASGDGRVHVLHLATLGEGPSTLRTKDKEVAFDGRLAPGEPVDVGLESVDGDARAWFDGHEVAVLADDLSIEESMAIADQGVKSAPALAFRARGSAVVVTDVRVDRDIYYLGGREDASNVPFTGQSFPLGEDEYFLMGDNTQHSSDSRKWKAQGRKLKDGTTVWWDWQNGPRVVEEGGKRWSEVTDVDGILRRWTDEDRSPDGGEPQERRSVVTRDRIVGKAFFALVFWPLDENFLARIRFIH